MKCSAVRVAGEWRDVFKDPATDHGKKSKKGRVDLFTKSNGTYFTATESDFDSELKVAFENGELKNEITFDEVRANSRM